MNRGLKTPFDNPDSTFHKEKNKHVGESSNKPVRENKFESFEMTTLNKKGSRLRARNRIRERNST